MGWVRGIRDVRHREVSADAMLAGIKRGPVVTRVERVITELPARSVADIVGRQRAVELPEHTGAGPCGTLARRDEEERPARCALTWSIEHLVAPLQAYYATYEPPMRFGAKPGPRGRRGIYDEIDAPA